MHGGMRRTYCSIITAMTCSSSSQAQLLGSISTKLSSLAGRDLYTCGLHQVRQCRSFLQRARQQDYAARYRRLVSGLDEDSLDCVGSILGRVELVAGLQDQALQGGVSAGYPHPR